jgi:hypothetical protein
LCRAVPLTSQPGDGHLARRRTGKAGTATITTRLGADDAVRCRPSGDCGRAELPNGPCAVHRVAALAVSRRRRRARRRVVARRYSG